MGVNSLQVSWHRQPSSLRLGGLGQTVESLVRETSLKSYFFPSPSLSTSLTFNQMDYKQKWSTLNILLIKISLSYIRQTLKTAYSKRRRVSGHHMHPTYLPTWSQLQRRERQLQGAYQRRPTPLETQEKRQRQKHTHNWQQSTRAQSRSIPGKRQPIKFELYLLEHKHTAKYVRVHLRHLGVYKDSRVAYRAIRVRVS